MTTYLIVIESDTCIYLIQMLVVFKSAPILKRTLKVKHALLQLYVLKLLKMQTKYLGRQWRKSNMKTMSAIYQKVRHRLNDDWAYGNGEFFCLFFRPCSTMTLRIASIAAVRSFAMGYCFSLLNSCRRDPDIYTLLAD